MSVKNSIDNRRYIEYVILYCIDTGCSQKTLLQDVYDYHMIFKLDPELHPICEVEAAIERLISDGRIGRENREFEGQNWLFWIQSQENIERYYKECEWAKKVRDE